MSKHIDENSIIEKLQLSLNGKSLVPKESLKIAEPRPDIDLFEEMEKRAALFHSEVIDNAHKSVKMPDIGADILNNSDRQKLVLKSLGFEKQAALRAMSSELKAIANKADKAGLHKQAADLRFVASKLV